MALAVGDKVRFTEDYNECSATRRVNKGEEGVIESIYSNGALAQVNLGGSRKDIGVFLKRLEKVEGLKVGDRVRVTSALPPGFDSSGEAVPGVVGVIVDMGRSSFPYRVRLDGFKREHYFKARELEKIEEPELKFRVGDIVRWSATSPRQRYRILGRSRDLAHRDADYDWRLENLATGNQCNVIEAELTKVESVPFKLERGDKVVNRKTGRKGFVSGGLVLDEDPPYGNPVPVKALEEYEEHHPGTYDLIKKDAPW